MSGEVDPVTAAKSSPAVTLGDTTRARRLLTLIKGGHKNQIAADPIGFSNTAASMAELNMHIRGSLGGTTRASESSWN